MADAVFYDGETARRRTVSLRVTASSIDIDEAGERIASWPNGEVRRQEAPAGILRLSPDGASLARLDLADPVDQAAIRAQCRHLASRGEGERVGRIVFWSLAAAASLVFCAFVLVPLLADRAVPLIPASLERRLGTAVDNQVRVLFGGRTCEAPDGRQALTKLSNRLARLSPSEVLPEIAVLSSRVPNAVALPGGRIYLFDGLLQQAESVDEVAGVLAHEIGHVANRDGLRKLLQTGGTSFLLGLLFGDVTGGGAIVLATRLAVDSAYSRDAERAADAFAMEAMLALGRPPDAMGRLLSRIDDGHDVVPPFLSSHPLTDARLRAMSERKPDIPGEPLLTEEEWRRLKEICKAE
jgi:predicted Zn-dependent protease